MDAAAAKGGAAEEARQPQGQPPGSLAAELCALLARRAGGADGGVGEAELRAAAEAVAGASGGLGLPSLEALWPRGAQ